MKLLFEIAVPFLWLVSAVFFGIIEGYLYNYRDSKDIKYKFDLHKTFTFQRAIVLIGIALPFILYSEWYYLPIILLSMIFLFPLIHDGSYYMTRHSIDKKLYKDGFLAESKSSTAKIELGLFQRIILAILECGCLW